MLWIKSFHIIFMVTWFAGLFYLPRLFVYHAETSDSDKIGYNRFCIMERKLFWGIMTPSGILTIAFGIWLLFSMGWSPNEIHHMKWLQIKIFLVFILILY